jgi:hypothetical protein
MNTTNAINGKKQKQNVYSHNKPPHVIRVIKQKKKVNVALKQAPFPIETKYRQITIYILEMMFFFIYDGYKF